jgi:hypothetical protein
MALSRTVLAKELISHGVLDTESLTVDSLLARVCGFVENPSDLFDRTVLYYKVTTNGVTLCDKSAATVKLLKVNLPMSKKDLYVAFYLRGAGWEGITVGGKDNLLSIPVRSGYAYCSLEFLKRFYDILLDKEKWLRVLSSGFLDFFRLRSYLSNLCLYAKRIGEFDPDSGSVIFNKSKTKVMFSINLLNIFGNRIILSHTIRTITDARAVVVRYLYPVIIGSAKDAEVHGFDSKDYMRLEPIKFYNSADDLIFQGTIEEFDLEDIHHMSHIRFDRKARLPKFMNDMDEASLSVFIRNTIAVAIKRNTVDYKWIIPSFSVADAMTLFLIPIFEPETSEPVCALLVGKKSTDVWTVFTVLDLEQAYLSARHIAPPCGWLDFQYP